MQSKFVENYKYLCAGEYVFDDSMMFIFRKDNQSYNNAIQLFGDNIKLIPRRKKIFVLLIKLLLFNKRFVIKEPQKQAAISGTVFFIGVDNSSTAKIFDFSNRKVLKIYFAEKEFDKTIQDYNDFKSYLSTPEILFYDSKGKMIIEELIVYKPYKKWSKDDSIKVITDIFERYIIYCQSCKSKGKVFYKKPISLLDGFTREDKVKTFIIGATNEEIMNMEFPFLKLHGDLWAPNILLNNNQINYIDFEFADNYIVFYDIFWFIQDQVINHQNYYYLEEYIAGTFDPYFQKMFQIFDLVFDERYRLDYVNLYFANVYEKRWRHLNSKERDIQLYNYQNMVKRMQITQFV